MRFVAVLCFLAALWTIDANPILDDLEIWRLQVRNAKWTVEGIIRQLQFLHSQSEEDIIRKVTEKWNKEQDNHRSFKTELINGIKKDVNAAKLEGKDVTSCYNEALNGIKESDDIVNEDATKCNDVAENSIQSNLGFIDNLISTANDLLLELDSIFLICHDSDIVKMRSCIANELAKIDADIRTLQSDSNSAEITVTHVSNNIVLQATNCLKKAYSFVYSAGVTIKTRLTQCIEKISDGKL